MFRTWPGMDKSLHTVRDDLVVSLIRWQLIGLDVQTTLCREPQFACAPVFNRFS